MRSKLFLTMILITAVVIVLSACSSSSDSNVAYTQLPQDKAISMMEENSDYVILDVRTQEEYDEGHIPDAICIPNETIGDKRPEELKDLDQMIFVYCRSGRRSKEASQKLADMGYTRVYEFGGINTWPGETVKDSTEDSSDSGKILIEVNGQILTAALEDNSSTHALQELIGDKTLTLQLEDYGNFEKVGPLPEALPTNDAQIDVDAGDLILYQGDHFSIYYDNNSWDFTKLGHIEGISKDELQKLLGSGDVEVTLRLDK